MKGRRRGKTNQGVVTEALRIPSLGVGANDLRLLFHFCGAMEAVAVFHPFASEQVGSQTRTLGFLEGNLPEAIALEALGLPPSPARSPPSQIVATLRVLRDTEAHCP